MKGRTARPISKILDYSHRQQASKQASKQANKQACKPASLQACKQYIGTRRKNPAAYWQPDRTRTRPLLVPGTPRMPSSGALLAALLAALAAGMGWRARVHSAREAEEARIAAMQGARKRPKPVTPANLVPDPEAPTLDIVFVLGGQSNMAGRGELAERADLCGLSAALPAEGRAIVQRLSADGLWEAAREPLHEDIDTRKTCGVGPGLVMAHRVAERLAESSSLAPGTRIGLVPCAVGGTSIEAWKQGSPLYRMMLERARLAQASRARAFVFVWYQGESDTQDAERAAQYESRLRELLNNVRSDLSMPALRMVLVGITGRSDLVPHLERVRSATRRVYAELARAGRGTVAMVDAAPLELKADGIHLTSAAQGTLGRMLGDAVVEHGMV